MSHQPNVLLFDNDKTQKLSSLFQKLHSVAINSKLCSEQISMQSIFFNPVKAEVNIIFISANLFADHKAEELLPQYKAVCFGTTTWPICVLSFLPRKLKFIC